MAEWLAGCPEVFVALAKITQDPVMFYMLRCRVGGHDFQ